MEKDLEKPMGDYYSEYLKIPMNVAKEKKLEPMDENVQKAIYSLLNKIIAKHNKNIEKTKDQRFKEEERIRKQECQWIKEIIALDGFGLD
jgi:hypothetical protein